MKNNPKELLNIFVGMLEHVSSDKEAAREYLSEKGYDTDKIVKDNILFINKTKTEKRAKLTREHFEYDHEQFKLRAKEMALSFISNPSFSIKSFWEQEQFAFNFRNLENLSKDELTEILEDYFFLKLSSQNKEQ